MAVMKEQTWERHSNPWSGWSRMVGYWALLGAIFLHNVWFIGIVIVFLIINPKLFPPPKHQKAWMSKSVLGEQIYTKTGMLKKDLPTFLNFLNLPFFVGSVYFSYTQNLWLAILTCILSTTYKLWFLDRMVSIYDQRPENTVK
jgi:hypothetical protein